MALNKVTYNDMEGTIIHDENLNDIQDEIIANAAAIGTAEGQISALNEKLAFANVTKARFATDTSGDYATFSWYLNDDDYYALVLSNGHCNFRKRINGQTTEIWESALKSDFTIKTDGFGGTLYARQCGKVVTINGYLAGNFNASVTDIGTLSNVAKPDITIRAVCGVGENAYSAQETGYFSVTTSGVMSVICKSGKTAKFVYVSLSYVVN